MKDLERVFEFENDFKIPETTYTQNYRHLLDYFSGISTLGIRDVVVGAHMIYGWMPTILHLNKGGKCTNLHEVVDILQTAKVEGAILTKSDLIIVKNFINNSIVGASKLLHFIALDHYPIWDSKIYQFIFHTKPWGYQVNNVQTYLDYQSALLGLKQHSKFPRLHEAVKQKLCDNEISGLRALELMMFTYMDRNDVSANKV